jgi:hypothetical protein
LPQIDLIPQPSDIDASWLTSLLGQTITSVSATPVGTGQVGATYRFGMRSSDADIPASLIGKFMSDDPVSRATGIAQSSYWREVNFYQTLGAIRPLPIPRAKFAEIDPTTHQFALIMDDFPHHRSGNQLEPATLAEAVLAMEAAAKIHAAFWGDSGLEAHPWLNGSQAASVMDVDGLYTMLWPAFCERYKDRINDQVLEAGQAYEGRINAWIANRTGPRCLTHGDYRPDNMLFNESDAHNPIVIVDWQTAGVGNGATDIAYYLGTALSPDVRRAHEVVIVAHWVRGLIEAGVPVSDTTELWRIYQRDAFAGFLMGVIASMIVAQTDRGDAMFLEMCMRSAAMVLDHRSMDLI